MLSQLFLVAVAASSALAMEAPLCERLSASLKAKGEAMAEACEAGRQECRTLAADYHVHLDSHKALCLAFASTVAPPQNVTGSVVPGNVTSSPMPGNVTALPSTPLPPCQHGGRRHQDLNGCVCAPCYTGPICQTYNDTKPYCPSLNASTPMPPINGSTTSPNPIVNGSTTSPMPVVNGSTTSSPVNVSCPPCLNGGQSIQGQGCLCRCPSCFWGPTCGNAYANCGNTSSSTVAPPPNPCASGPCLNGGICFPYNRTGRGYECACQNNYDGPNCGHYVQPSTIAPTTTTEKCHCVKKRFFVFCTKWEPAGCHDNAAEGSEAALELCMTQRPQSDAMRAFCQDLFQHLVADQ